MYMYMYMFFALTTSCAYVFVYAVNHVCVYADDQHQRYTQTHTGVYT